MTVACSIKSGVGAPGQNSERNKYAIAVAVNRQGAKVEQDVFVSGSLGTKVVSLTASNDGYVKTSDLARRLT